MYAKHSFAIQEVQTRIHKGITHLCPSWRDDVSQACPEHLPSAASSPSPIESKQRDYEQCTILVKFLLMYDSGPSDGWSLRKGLRARTGRHGHLCLPLLCKAKDTKKFLIWAKKSRYSCRVTYSPLFLLGVPSPEKGWMQIYWGPCDRIYPAVKIRL